MSSEALDAVAGKLRNRAARAVSPIGGARATIKQAVRNGGGSTLPQILGNAVLDAAVGSAFTAAKERSLKLIDAAALAGWRLGVTSARAQWAELGLPYVKAPDRVLSEYQAAVRLRAAEVFEQGRAELTGLMTAAFDGQDTAKARASAVDGVVDAWVRRSRLRVHYGAQSALRRGFHEATGAWAEKITQTFPATELVKTWRVRSMEPCACCLALDGVSVPVGSEFPLPEGCSVFHDLLAPPAHPNCGCDPEYGLSVAGEHVAAVDEELDVLVPDPPTGPTVGGFPAFEAAQVRKMKKSFFVRLVSFLLKAAGIIRRLRPGG